MLLRERGVSENDVRSRLAVPVTEGVPPPAWPTATPHRLLPYVQGPRLKARSRSTRCAAWSGWGSAGRSIRKPRARRCGPARPNWSPGGGYRTRAGHARRRLCGARPSPGRRAQLARSRSGPGRSGRAARFVWARPAAAPSRFGADSNPMLSADGAVVANVGRTVMVGREPVTLPGERRVSGNVSLSADGHQLAFDSHLPQEPGGVYLWEDGNISQVSADGHQPCCEPTARAWSTSTPVRRSSGEGAGRSPTARLPACLVMAASWPSWTTREGWRCSTAAAAPSASSPRASKALRGSRPMEARWPGPWPARSSCARPDAPSRWVRALIRPCRPMAAGWSLRMARSSSSGRTGARSPSFWTSAPWSRLLYEPERELAGLRAGRRGVDPEPRDSRRQRHRAVLARRLPGRTLHARAHPGLPVCLVDEAGARWCGSQLVPADRRLLKCQGPPPRYARWLSPDGLEADPSFGGPYLACLIYGQ